MNYFIIISVGVMVVSSFFMGRNLERKSCQEWREGTDSIITNYIRQNNKLRDDITYYQDKVLKITDDYLDAIGKKELVDKVGE